MIWTYDPARLTAMRVDAKLSQAELAARVYPDAKPGTRRNYISRYETGKNVPSAEVIGRLATALGVSPEAFFISRP